ncbi:hypothetical protein Bhz51_00231 [Stenotrophomonas phage vB_SmaM_Bhz51]
MDLNDIFAEEEARLEAEAKPPEKPLPRSSDPLRNWNDSMPTVASRPHPIRKRMMKKRIRKTDQHP